MILLVSYLFCLFAVSEYSHIVVSYLLKYEGQVPGNVVQHCNGRTYDNAYLITFKVGPLRTHALAPSILPLLVAPAKSSFGIFRSSAVAFNLMSSMVVKCVPWRPIFRVGNSQKHSCHHTTTVLCGSHSE